MAVDLCFPPDLAQTSLVSRRPATVMPAPGLRLSYVLCVSSQQAGRGQSGNPAGGRDGPGLFPLTTEQGL